MLQPLHGLCPIRCEGSYLTVLEIGANYSDTLRNMDSHFYMDKETRCKWQGRSFIDSIDEQYTSTHESLSNVIRLIVGRHLLHTEATLLKSAFFKNESYVTRLFGNENWDEWTECRTALGKVIHIFCDFASQPYPFNPWPFTDRLSNELIEKANQEAHAILRSLSLVPDAANHNLPEVFDEKCYDEEIYITGSADDQSIWSVASVGDMNGDGFADILIGAPVTKSRTGAAYVVYSQQSSPSLSLESESNQESLEQAYKRIFDKFSETSHMELLYGAPHAKSRKIPGYEVDRREYSPSFKLESDSSDQSEKTIFKINSDTSQEKSVSSFTSDGINYLIVSKNGPWTDVNSEEWEGSVQIIQTSPAQANDSVSSEKQNEEMI